MTMKEEEHGFAASAPPPPLPPPSTLPPPPPPPLPQSKQKRMRQTVIVCLATFLVLVVLLALVGFILAVTVFRMREPRTQLVSASLEGVAPKLSIPEIKVELNITLNITLLVQNRNHASFKGGLGRTMLLYQGNQIGEAELNPGLIPARGTATLWSNVTLEIDRFGDSGLASLVRDMMAGQITMKSKTRIPGRVNLLGIFKKHMLSSSDCQFVIGFPELKIKSQDCKFHNKL